MAPDPDDPRFKSKIGMGITLPKPGPGPLGRLFPDEHLPQFVADMRKEAPWMGTFPSGGTAPWMGPAAPLREQHGEPPPSVRISGPNCPPQGIGPPLAELREALHRWDQEAGLVRPFLQGHAWWEWEGGMADAALEKAGKELYGEAMPSPPDSIFVGPHAPRVEAEAPRVLEWGVDFVRLEWLIRECGHGCLPVMDCRLEQARLDQMDRNEASAPCQHLPEEGPRKLSEELISRLPGTCPERHSLWQATVRRLGRGEAHRFRALPEPQKPAREAVALAGGHAAGPWSELFRAPVAPRVPMVPRAEAVSHETVLGEAGFPNEGLVRLIWDADLQPSGGAAALPLQGCEVQQRAQSATHGGIWEAGHHCSYLLPPRQVAPPPAEGRDSGSGMQRWDCVVRVPTEPRWDRLGRCHVLKLQFRVRTRNEAGPSGWSAWSEHVANEEAAAATQAAVGWRRSSRQAL